MAKISKIILLLAIMISASVHGIIDPSLARAQNGIQFSDTEVINRFPDEMVFRIIVSSLDAEIESVKFAYTRENLYSSRSYTKDTIAFEPGSEVVLEYTLDTRDLTTPPLMTYLFYWEVKDSNGNKYQSEPVIIRYEDNRYDWQVLENEDIGVWWHDRSQAFGQTIFDIAAEAVAAQQDLFQTDLDFQMLIVISNTNEEFNSWHNIEHDWIGGQTFSDFGITNQIVQGESYQESWLYGVIPHEISHIFFNHVVHNPVVSVPVWLNEGVAQYNEFISHEWEIGLVESAAENNTLIPLTSLEDGFGSYDVDRVYLSYAEAYSAVAYLVDTYGSEGLSALLKAYKDGEATDKAFQNALGISADQFELDWADSVGAENYQIPTPWVMPTFFPSPTVYTPGEGASTDSGREPSQTPEPPAPDAPSGEEDLAPRPIRIMPLILLGTIFLLSAGIGFFILFRKRNI